jgi:hypothetical protein
LQLRPLTKPGHPPGKSRPWPLRKEIAVALAVKTALLFVLWYAFFSEPQDRRLTPEQVSAAVLAPHPAPHGK